MKQLQLTGLVAMLGLTGGLYACGGQEFASNENTTGGSGGSSSGGSDTGGSSTGGHGTGGSAGSGGSTTGGSGGLATGGTTGTGGATGTPCGDATCGDGEYCCDASCSLCAPFGSGCSCPSTGVQCGSILCGKDQQCCDATCGYCANAGEPCAAGVCAMGVPCGPTTCGNNEQCCDEACGACALADSPCPSDPCGTSMTVRCGTYNSCSGGEFCCDATCGTCSSNGACPLILIACVPDCAAMDATGTAGCDVPLGYKWNGSACEQVYGCDCTGGSCDVLFEQLSDCQAAYDACNILPTP